MNRLPVCKSPCLDCPARPTLEETRVWPPLMAHRPFGRATACTGTLSPRRRLQLRFPHAAAPQNVFSVEKAETKPVKKLRGGPDSNRLCAFVVQSQHAPGRDANLLPRASKLAPGTFPPCCRPRLSAAVVARRARPICPIRTPNCSIYTELPYFLVPISAARRHGPHLAEGAGFEPAMQVLPA